MELTYTKQGDYLLPNLTIPESPMIGKYGMLRRSYLREYRHGIYTGLLLTANLNNHLMEIDQQANETMKRLTEQMTKTQGITENLKSSNQMRWVQMMNNIRMAAEEIVRNDLIYR